MAQIEDGNERSVGCVGILKNWLNRALAATLQDDQPTLTHKYLEQHAEPTRKLLRLARELREGDEALREKAEERSELHTLLGIPAKLPQKNEGTSGAEAKQATAAGHQSARVGQRRPTRDLVGGAPHAR